MRNIKIEIQPGQMKRRILDIDLIQLQKEIQEAVPGLESISMCSTANGMITEITLHCVDDASYINPKGGDEKAEREKSKKHVLDSIAKHQRKIEVMETIPEAIQRTKGRNTNERLDNIERILSQLPENLKIKKV